MAHGHDGADRGQQPHPRKPRHLWIGIARDDEPREAEFGFVVEALAPSEQIPRVVSSNGDRHPEAVPLVRHAEDVKIAALHRSVVHQHHALAHGQAQQGFVAV